VHTVIKCIPIIRCIYDTTNCYAKVEIYMACTGSHADIVDIVSRVKFSRIVACFRTLLSITTSILGISLIGSEQGSEIKTLALQDKLSSSYQHLFHHAWQFAVAISTYLTKIYILYGVWHMFICKIATFGMCPTISKDRLSSFFKGKNFPLTSIHRIVLGLV